ncbi:MAG: hypothetical protein AB1846_16830 [Chloroflexota bacterium]
MSQFSYKSTYRRNLPHIQPEGATLFITFRLANSLPKEVVERLLAEKEQAEKKISQITDKVGGKITTGQNVTARNACPERSAGEATPRYAEIASLRSQ